MHLIIPTFDYPESAESIPPESGGVSTGSLSVVKSPYILPYPMSPIAQLAAQGYFRVNLEKKYDYNDF